MSACATVAQVNIRAWSEAVVPNFVTSNCFIAGCYARNILSFICDWYKTCVVRVARVLARAWVSLTRTTREGADKSQPVHIVEVGAGHGKMAFLMVTKLLELREFFPVERPFKYVMTDFTQVRCVARP